MKKLLLGLGVLPLLTLPVIGLVSCGQPEKSKLQNKIDEPTLQNQIDKLEDSITKNPNATTNQVLNDINGALDIDGRKRELEKVFTLPEFDLGFSISQIIPILDKNNKTNLSVEIIIQKDSSPTDTLSKTIVISGLKTITPKEITSKETKPKETTPKETTPKEITKNLDITATPSTQAKIDEAIKEYKAARANKSQQLVALKQIFVGSGLTLDHLENFSVKITDTVPGIITLIAKPGFTINGTTSLSSKLAPIIDLKITAIPSTQVVIDKAIADFNKLGASDIAKITALSTVFRLLGFSSIAPEILKNITVVAMPTFGKTPGEITLKTKPGLGLTINGTTSISSSLKSAPITPVVPTIVDLKITAIPSTQEVIDQTISTYRGATLEQQKISALSTIFSGITSENFKNITVTPTTTTFGKTPGTIILTAKSGFTINGTTSISSSLKSAPITPVVPTIVDLKITAIPSTQEVIDKAIATYKGAMLEQEKVNALSTIFSGITSENFKNITVTPTTTFGKTPGTIILRAKTGFTINGTTSTSSSLKPAPITPVVPKTVDLKITAIPSTRAIIFKANTDYKSGSNESAKIAALSTVFEGITSDNFKNIIVLASPSIITLRANHNFTINGKSTLSSKLALITPVVPTIVDLKITAIPSTQEVIDQTIGAYNWASLEQEKVNALSKVFSGITTNNLSSFDVVVARGTARKPGKIVLRAKQNFTINGVTSISSSLAPIVDLKITAIPSTRIIIDKAIIDFNKAGTNESAKISALSTLFSGITLDNFQHIDSLVGTTSITLVANSGFTINGNKTLSLSFKFTPVVPTIVDLKITAIPSTKVVIYKALDDFIQARTLEVRWSWLGNQDDVKIAVLSTVFDGITEDNFKNFNITPITTSGSTLRTIILTANSGFTFNGRESISSMVDLKITTKPSTKATIDQAIIDFNNAGTNDSAKISALSTLFSGITLDNFQHINSLVGTTSITLVANSGFTFNGNPILFSIDSLQTIN